jgi:hypothetical protein
MQQPPQWLIFFIKVSNPIKAFSNVLALTAHGGG